MNFQAYVLKKHGYTAYTLKILGHRNSHVICIYKDKNTGKWNAINYERIYYSFADSPEEVLNKTYPGWVAYDLYDPVKEKTIKRYIGSTKLYLQNLIED